MEWIQFQDAVKIEFASLLKKGFGSKCFPFIVDPFFSDGPWYARSKLEVTKVVSIINNVGQPTKYIQFSGTEQNRTDVFSFQS